MFWFKKKFRVVDNIDPLRMIDFGTDVSATLQKGELVVNWDSDFAAHKYLYPTEFTLAPNNVLKNHTHFHVLNTLSHYFVYLLRHRRFSRDEVKKLKDGARIGATFFFGGGEVEIRGVSIDDAVHLAKLLNAVLSTDTTIQSAAGDSFEVKEKVRN